MIAGIGNPGGVFEKTVHNVGFAIVDRLREYFVFNSLQSHEQALLWRGYYKTEEILLVKPRTFVNESGSCVSWLMKKFNLQVQDILILQDDISLQPGKIRFKRNSSSGGHNGLKDIINSVGTNNFARVKIGVGNDRSLSLDRWVVQKLTSKKWNEILSVQPAVLTMVIEWIEGAR